MVEEDMFEKHLPAQVVDQLGVRSHIQCRLGYRYPASLGKYCTVHYCGPPGMVGVGWTVAKLRN